MIFNALFITCKCTFYEQVYVGQLLVRCRALLPCSDVIFNVHNMCIIGANKR